RFYNITKENRLLLALSCHSSSCTSFSFNPFVPGLFLTAGTDKLLKIWSFDMDGSEEVKCLVEREDKLGKIFSASFCADNPWLIAAAGSKATLKVLNLMDFST